MKSIIIRGLVLAVLAFCVFYAAYIAAGKAYAVPTFDLDPHLPQPAVGFCPGGGDGGFGAGYCDGVPYPDGTFWHSARGFIPFKGWTTTLYCAADHNIMPTAAGPGGCGGAV